MPLSHHLIVIAGPSGSGKDSVAAALLARFSNIVRTVTATTRAPRPGEVNGVNYHFLTNEQFKEALAAGNILEYYHRPDTDTYYGTYKPDIEARLVAGKIVISVVQIVGAKYLKEHYGATTFFIMPPSPDAFEARIRARSPMSDVEWEERRKITEDEVTNDAPWYDYRIVNEDGKLEQAVESVIKVLHSEGFVLENA